MMADFDLFVFDLDGTLVDTIPDIAGAFNTVFESRGMPLHDARDYESFVGWGLERTLEMALPRSLPDHEFQEILSAVLTEYRANPCEASVAYPGIDKILDFLSDKGIPALVYTNKAEELAVQVVEGVFQGRFFNGVIGSRVDRPDKPDPTALKDFLRDEFPGSLSILYVGDSPVDVETAARAKVNFIGAAWGYRSPEDLRNAGCEKLFADPVELYQWLSGGKDKAYDE